MLFVKSIQYGEAVNMEHVVYTDVVKQVCPDLISDEYVLQAHTITGRVIPIAFGNIPEALYERQKKLFRLVEVPNGYMENEYCDLCDKVPVETSDEVPF